MRALERYSWPGNVRELQHFIERSVILTRGSELNAPVEELADGPAHAFDTLAYAHRAHILAALRQTRGVVGGRNGAAARLGIPRTTLIAKMRRLGMRRMEAGRFEETEWQIPN